MRGIAGPHFAVQIGIVATGGAVRLTGSGLGCPTWPRCTPETFIVMLEQGIHGAIEFGNRMLTFELSAVALLAVLFVWKLRSRRPDLWRLALLLAAGIPAQAALGGLTVLTGLNPWLVGAHFIVSAGLASMAAVFVLRVLDGPPSSTAPSSLRPLARAAAAAVGDHAVHRRCRYRRWSACRRMPRRRVTASTSNGSSTRTRHPALRDVRVDAAARHTIARAGLERVRPLAYGLQHAGTGADRPRCDTGAPRRPRPLLVGIHMVPGVPHRRDHHGDSDSTLFAISIITKTRRSRRMLPEERLRTPRAFVKKR